MSLTRSAARRLKSKDGGAEPVMADRRCADQRRRRLRSLNADDTLGSAAAPSDAPGTPVAASGHSPQWPSGGTHCTRRLRDHNHNRPAKACKNLTSAIPGSDWSGAIEASECFPYRTIECVPRITLGAYCD